MASTSEWTGGERYGGGGNVFYHIMRGTVTGAAPGDNVTVWFTGAGKTSPSFTFHVDHANADDVLILADTDYTGPSNFPAYTAGDGTPPFLSRYTDAVEAAGYTWDLYDVDALGAAPDHLGVLGHYDAVIWYTGNDLLSRVPGQPGGTGAEALANSMMLTVRAYLNEGGRLLYTGRHAGWQFANAFDYNPISTPPFCNNVDQTVDDGCLQLSDDFLQYWLGAYLFIEDGGADADGNSFPVLRTDTPYTGLGPWEIDQRFTPGRDATNQSFITTSSILKTDDYPQFTSTGPAEWQTGIAGAYEPHSGSYYIYSQRADVRYQRLMNSFTVDDGTDLSFFVSYDTEPNLGLPVRRGAHARAGRLGHTAGGGHHEPRHRGVLPREAGSSCIRGWSATKGADCSGAGWNATSGRSPGWQQWTVDLSAWQNQQVEVSISYVQDWATQGLGVWIDDIDAPTNTASVDTDFESGDLGTWTVGDPTEIGSDVNPLDWIVTTDVGFVEGAMTSMDPPGDGFKTLYFGFGFENVVGEAARNEIMQQALDYLTS